MQELVLAHCKNDIIYWINNWVWTLDPRQSPSILPLVMFERQEEYIRWRQERRSRKENGVIEKSRDMGITWLNICCQVHAWLFEAGYNGSFGSRKETLVDRIGDPDSIFEKIRILLKHLPKWMLPKGFDWKKHDTFCKLINPENGSVITGEAGDNIGRGGRSSVYDLDEAAFIERPQKVDAALSNNTEVLFYTSSANGFNFFYKKRSKYPPECVFQVHWKDDPRKNYWELRDRSGDILQSGNGRKTPTVDKDAGEILIYPWYAQMCSKYDEVTVASEVDINYGASIEGIYIPAHWVLAAVELDLPASGEQLAALDVATTGVNQNVFGVRQGPVVQHIEHWNGIDTTQTAFKVIELMRDRKLTHLAFDADGVGAGVAGTLANTYQIDFMFTALHGQSTPSGRVWEGEDLPNGKKKTSKEKFANGRAEWWGILNERFKKTYDHVNGAKQYPLDELISIPNHPTLIAQLSTPLRKWTSAGKILIESKEDMRNRGVESPDFADMLAYLFAPIEEAYFGVSEGEWGY